MRERMYELETPEEVNEFFEKFPSGAIFKAGGCHKTMEGFARVEEALVKRPEIHVGFIRVIESRPASNHVVERTGVIHQSPQFILLADGKPVFDLDNWDITEEALEAGLEQILGPATGCGEIGGSDLSSYVGLLENYVGGSLEHTDFRDQWLSMFQQDASPRSKEELEHLTSLFGDVDAAIVSLPGADHGMLDRAKSLLKMLESSKLA